MGEGYCMGKNKACKREIYEFWTSVLRDESAEIKDRIKISELLAKAMDLFSPSEQTVEEKGKEEKRALSLEEKLEIIRRIKNDGVDLGS